jgi:hypothetical protein
MGRRKKEDIESEKPVELAQTNSTTCTIDKTEYLGDRTSIRNYLGLLKNLEYHYDEFGYINWRQMINPKHVVLNKYAYAKDGVDVMALSQDEQEKLLVNASEDRKLIKLIGFRELAKIRGFLNVRHDIVYRDPTSVAASCTIDWIPNFECSNVSTYSTIANASVENVDNNFTPFLESIACNRAFVRTVREFLNIPILGQDEIKNDENVNINKSPTAHRMLGEWMTANNFSFEHILAALNRNGIELKEDWVNLDVLPTPVVITALELISKKQKD